MNNPVAQCDEQVIRIPGFTRMMFRTAHIHVMPPLITPNHGWFQREATDNYVSGFNASGKNRFFLNKEA